MSGQTSTQPTLTTLVNFSGGNGANPLGNLIADAAGDLFGTTEVGGSAGGGTVFELANGGSSVTTLATFIGDNGAYPTAGLIADAAGNLFGTTDSGGGAIGAGDGTVFELARGASSITTLANFTDNNGAQPFAGLIADAAGDLFGTTFAGGSTGFGTVFELVKGAASVTTLASFNDDNDGAYPEAKLIADAAGNLFGTTEGGGSADYGTVFELVKGAASVTTLASFNNNNGAYPESELVADAAGDLFGTTEYGGSAGGGTVFELVKGASSVTTLASFTDTDGGTAPTAGLILDAAGDLFGTTQAGGSAGSGTVFELANGASSITSLASFTGSNGAYPYAGLTADAAGDLFGTTTSGGSADEGTVFELKNAGFVAAVAPTLSGGTAPQTTTSEVPVAPFSGVTVGDINTGATDTLAISLTGTGGTLAGAGLSVSAGGVYTLSGSATAITTALDALTFTPTAGLPGTSSTTVFSLSDQSTAFATPTTTTVLVIDINATPPVVTLAASPFATNAETATLGTAAAATPGNTLSVTLTSDADFTSGSTLTLLGGTLLYTPGPVTTANAEQDTIAYTVTDTTTGAMTAETQTVTLTPATLTTLVDFEGDSVDSPVAGLVADASGDLFGTTEYGSGANGLGDGTVFELAKGASSVTTLASFTSSTGAFPIAGLIADAAGDLFGTTKAGGSGDVGTVFELIKGASSVTTLASFTSSTGAFPIAGLIADAAGDLFGTTYSGGSVGVGTVFELIKGASAVTTLASFNFSTGDFPFAGLIADAAGDLFGTTAEGGSAGHGTVFELAAGAPSITTLASFTGSNGARPIAGLIADAAGDFFGTTARGGSRDEGTVFELVKGASSITTLASFTGDNGVDPAAGLIADAAGDLFGTTAAGGRLGDGTVFELVKGASSVSTLAKFTGNDGSVPVAGLIADAAGNLFGTTKAGGSGGNGTLFEVTNAGFKTAVVPTLSGGAASQTTTSEALVTPFAKVTVSDTNSNATTHTLTISSTGTGGTLTGAGLSGGAGGVYTLTGLATAVTTALDALTFTPTAGLPGTSNTTTFTLSDQSTGFTTPTTANFSVTDTDPAVAPTFSGGTASQTTTSETPVAPFSGVTVDDANLFGFDTLAIILSGAGGTLAGAALLGGDGGVYVIQGDANDITSTLDALVFIPTAGLPGTSNTTTFTLSDQSTGFTTPTTANFSVTDTDPAVAPTFSGGTASQITTSEAPVAPFSGVTINDANVGVTDTLTISLTGTGGTLAGTGLSGGAGVYTLTGSAAAISTALDALTFTPTAGHPSTNNTTNFTLSDQSTAFATPATASVSVVDTDPAVAPILLGGEASQTTVAEAPVAPFSGVTISDPNTGATDTLTISLSGNGTLAGTGLSGGAGGVYTLSGAAAVLTTALDALTFTPTASLPGTSSTTNFTLSDQSTAFATPTTASVSVIDLDPASTTVSGHRQKVTLASGDTNVSISGYYNQVTGTGTAPLTVGITGLGNTLDLGNGNDAVTTTGNATGSVIDLGDGDDQLTLGTNNNQVTLGNGSDTVTSTGFNNTSSAGNGADTINGGTGHSTITLGDGTDTVSLGGWVNTVTVGDGNDTIDAGAGSATITVGRGDDTVVLHGRNNVVKGGDGDDIVTGGSKANSVTLGDGNDIVSLAGILNLIDFGDGANIVTAGSGQDSVTVGTGANVITLAGSDNFVSGGNGETTVTGTNSVDDQITLGDGADAVTLDGNLNTIHLGNGADHVTLFGQGNTVVAGSGGVAVTGGAGNNSITLGDGSNTVQLGGWVNTVSIAGGTSVVDAGLGAGTIQIAGGTATLTLHGRSDMVFLQGSTQASITDLSKGLDLSIDSGDVVASITGFGASTGGLVDLAGAGFASVSQVLGALHSDGHGGTLLALGSTGSIDFLNLAPNALHASNFSVV